MAFTKGKPRKRANCRSVLRGKAAAFFAWPAFGKNGFARRVPASWTCATATNPPQARLVETYTVITTTPNSMVAAVHNRMPVILSPEHYQWWLEPKRFEPEFLKSILRPYPAEDMDYSIRRASDTIRSPVYIIRCLPDAIRRMVDSIRWPSYRLR